MAMHGPAPGLKRGIFELWVLLSTEGSLVVGVACLPIYGPAPGFEGRTLSSGFSTDGSSISASAVPHCGWVKKEEEEEGIARKRKWVKTIERVAKEANSPVPPQNHAPSH